MYMCALGPFTYCYCHYYFQMISINKTFSTKKKKTMARIVFSDSQDNVFGELFWP